MKNPMHRLESLTVADVMAHKVVTVVPEQRMSDVASLFLHNGISSAPVVNQNGLCVGILSAFDFLKRDAATAGNGDPLDRSKAALTVRDAVESFMSPRVKSVRAETSLLQAANAMCNLHVHRLPVIDRAGKPIGVISTMDLVAALLNALDEAHQDVA